MKFDILIMALSSERPYWLKKKIFFADTLCFFILLVSPPPLPNIFKNASDFIKP